MAAGGGKFVVVAAFLLAVTAARAQADIGVYSDSLSPRWRDSSWGRVVRDLDDVDRAHDGRAAIGVSYTGGWSAFELRSQKAVDVSKLSALRFFVHGGAFGGQRIEVRCGLDSGRYVSRTVLPVAGEWSEVTIPLADLGPRRRIDYILWFSLMADPQQRFYVDEVALVSNLNAESRGSGSNPVQLLRVDSGAERGRISPGIYGMNFADEDVARDLRIPVRRWGGNATTRYNWQKDVSNSGHDWFFENIPYQDGAAPQLPHGSTTDQFVEQDRRTGAATLLTVPMIGWTAKSRSRLCGFGVTKYGKQSRVDPWSTTCGDGVAADGQLGSLHLRLPKRHCIELAGAQCLRKQAKRRLGLGHKRYADDVLRREAGGTQHAVQKIRCR